MKNLFFDSVSRVVALAFTILPVVGIKHAGAQDDVPHEIVDFEVQDDGELAQRGREAAAALFGNLMGRLAEAMSQGGTEAAIRVCQSEAQALTGQTAAELAKKGIASVRRVGVRVRNPKNLPDAIDRKILEDFLARWNPDSPQPPAGQVIFLPQTGQHRYYHPVPVAASCLACHGSPSNIEPKTAALIEKFYPEDKAVGFAEGDLRGAIVVGFSSPQGTKAQSE